MSDYKFIPGRFKGNTEVKELHEEQYTLTEDHLVNESKGVTPKQRSSQLGYTYDKTLYTVLKRILKPMYKGVTPSGVEMLFYRVTPQLDAYIKNFYIVKEELEKAAKRTQTTKVTKVIK